MNKEVLFEKLAAIEHERWADWQKWCHKVLRENCPSSEMEKVLERWDRQIATPYSELSEEEKDSDRKQVERYWDLVCSNKKEEEFILVQDDSCHWYIIPENREGDWDDWLESDEIELGCVPGYAVPINGSLRRVKILEYRIR